MKITEILLRNSRYWGSGFKQSRKKKVIKRELYDQKELKLAVGRDLKLGETSRGERQNSSA